MPKVPQVFASPDAANTGRTEPVQAPQDFGGGYGFLREGLGDLKQAAHTYARTREVLGEEQTKIDAAVAMGEMERQAAEADIKRKQDTSIRPEDYAQRVDDDLAAIRKGVGRTIKNEKSKALFDLASEHFVTKKSIEGKYDGLEMANSSVKAGADVLLRGYGNKAIFSPKPEDRQAAKDAGMAMIDDYLAKRIFTPDQARVKKAEFLENVQIGTLELDFRDPRKRLEIISLLRRGNYPDIDGTKQMALADEFEKKEYTLTKRHDDEVKQQEQALQDESHRGITDLVVSGRFALARQKLIAEQRMYPGTRYQEMHTWINNQENQDIPSNPLVLDPLSRRAHDIDTNPKQVMADLQDAFEKGAVRRKDFEPLANHLETRINKLAEGDPRLARRHSEAQKMIQEALRVTGPLKDLDLRAQGLYSMALEDLSRNSSYLGKGDEDPLAWFERRKAFYIGQLMSSANNRMNIISNQLRTGDGKPFQMTGNYQADAARLQSMQSTFKTRSGEFDNAAYWDAARLLLEHNDLALEKKRMNGILNPMAPQGEAAGGPQGGATAPQNPSPPKPPSSQPGGGGPSGGGGGIPGTVRGRTQ